ncbi:hypothetical protein BGZ79_006489 [Entomortierella chlamydospora]|nr:hypothetical protein BGZ79_006489 [Entomortierella chlamydospora]
MALIQSLAMSAAGSRLLRDGNDTMEQVAARGISYILFYAIFGNLVRWSYGFSLLVPKDAEEQTVVQENQVTEYIREQTQPADGVLVNVDEPQPILPEHVAAASSASSMRTLGDESDEADEEEPISGHDHSNFFRSAHKSKSQKLSTHMQQLSPSAVRPTREFQTLLSSYQRRRRNSRHRRRSARSLIKQKASTAFDRIRQVLTPPLLTAIIALVIGLIPALHKFFMGHDSKFYSFIIHPIENCGAAAIPMILLCLGAQVVHFATASKSSNDSNSTILEGRGQPQRRRSFSTPSVFPHAHQVSESSSSDEDNQDQGWFRVQNPPKRNIYGRRGSSSSHFNPSSSTTTLFQSQLSDDDEITPLQSAFNGASELGLRGHRFKWLTPVVYVLFSRMVLVPLICLPAVLFHPDTLSPILTMDPTFSLTLVLISASPTAINMIQLCQIKGFFENDMAAVLFWSYCVLGIPCILGWSLVGILECVLNIWQLLKQRDLLAQTRINRHLWIDQAKASNLTGQPRIAIVTGGNTGLGYETAKALVEAGYTTIIACRSEKKAKESVEKIEEQTGIKGKTIIMSLDLVSLASIKAFARDFKAQFSHVDVLVNNAGMMDIPFSLTNDGYEMQFGVNHLGHYVLTLELLPLLNKARQGRVVVLSSGAMYSSSEINYDRLQSSKGYSRLGHYSYSKLANMLFTKALDRRLRRVNSKITVNACHPGACATDLFKHNPLMNVVMVPAQYACRSPLVGATSSIYLALAPELENTSGEYFFDQIPRTPSPIALNEESQEKLWAKSVEFTGLDFAL